MQETVWSVDALRAAVGAAGYELDQAAYGRVWALFAQCSADPTAMEELKRAAPEYGRREFLANVDDGGRPVVAAREDLAHARSVRDPEFDLWYQEANLPGDGRSVLLIARWLCHLAGFRHRTVHLFLDHPTHRNHTLIQVRGVDKDEAPGCFDLPVAGHVVSMDTVERTLSRELGEEIGLTTEMLTELTLLGTYEQGYVDDRSGFHNVEHHTVYRARLADEGWLAISAADHEVAAIAVFAVPDLEAMVERFPERVARGLRGSFPFYRRVVCREGRPACEAPRREG
jgi:8-oxo-dGTP pyrophosphatase MutT (NUDIX family)